MNKATSQINTCITSTVIFPPLLVCHRMELAPTPHICPMTFKARPLPRPIDAAALAHTEPLIVSVEHYHTGKSYSQQKNVMGLTPSMSNY